VIDTEGYDLLFQPKFNNDGFYFDGISDREYAGDPDTEVSNYVLVFFFCVATTAWKANNGNSVTLSSTEV
jgi:hypothetical protein